jgi:hypothetical protein
MCYSSKKKRREPFSKQKLNIEIPLTIICVGNFILPNKSSTQQQPYKRPTKPNQNILYFQSIRSVTMKINDQPAGRSVFLSILWKPKGEDTCLKNL